MRSSRAFAGILLSLAAMTRLQAYEAPSAPVAPPDIACCPGTDDCWADCDPAWPRFIVRAGALALRPQGRGPVPLVTGSNPNLQAADLDFKFQAGWEIAGIWNAGSDLAFEVRYFAVDSWTRTIENQFVSGIQTSNVQGYSILTFPVFDTVELASYRSALQSGEINARLASWESI